MKKLVIVLISLPVALGLLYAQPLEAKTKKPLTICRWIKTSWVCNEATEGLKKAKKIPTLEKIFTEDYDRIWDAMISVMEEKGLAVHPHGKMKVKKKKGRIKTKVYRYFKIFSAKPPVVQLDFRDSYKLRIQRIEVELPQAKAKATDKDAKMTDDKVVKGEKEASAVQTVTKVKLTIKRKFQVHDDMTRKWIAGDPDKYKVGYTTKYLLKAIEAKLKGSAKSAKLTNLIITPPVFVD